MKEINMSNNIYIVYEYYLKQKSTPGTRDAFFQNNLF
jgi:hypothetical protein